MRSALRNVMAALVALTGLGACQSYNVDPVKPGAVKVAKKPQTITGHKLPPNIMFVVDRSGSMVDPANNTGGTCETSQGSGVYDNERTTSCKWNNLLDVMTGPSNNTGSGFVSQVFSTLQVGGDSPRLGLVTFADPEHPAGAVASCTVGRLQVAIPLDATSTVAPIDSALLNNVVPAAATPTASTMASIAGYFPPATADRDNYAILLTDGAPNCNGTIDPTETNCGGDRCTSACSDWAHCPCNPAYGGSTAAYLCLDDTGLVNALTTLNSTNNIKTFVIGFGKDIANDTGAVHDGLNAAAVAGGEPTSDATFKYYKASSIDELQQALLAILGNINGGCNYNLDSPPASDKALQVIVVAPGAAACTSDADCNGGICGGVFPDGSTHCGRALDDNEVQVNGAKVTIVDVAPNNACKTLSDSTGSNPAAVEFRYISK